MGKNKCFFNSNKEQVRNQEEELEYSHDHKHLYI